MITIVVVVIAIFILVLCQFANNSNDAHKVKQFIEDEPLAPFPVNNKPFYKKTKIRLRLNRVRVRLPSSG